MPSWPLDPQRYEPRRGGDGQLVIFINGILTRPSDQWAWTDRAEDWFLKHTDQDVDSYEYWQTPVLGRLFGERGNVRAAEALVRGYLARGSGQAGVEGRGSRVEGWRVHLVGHSRGCEVARRLIVEHDVRVESLHLFAGAIDADFERNGLGAALREGRLGRVRAYTSRGDWVLRWIAAASLGLYGRLGFTGPRGVGSRDQGRGSRVEVIRRDWFGHGDWFSPWNFGETMRMVAYDLDELP